MADLLDDNGGDVFVYTGGGQVVPRGVTRVRIDKSVKIIPQRAFYRRRNLVSVETHDDVEKVEEEAFFYCPSLRGIKLPGVRVIEEFAFWSCRALSDLEFGHKLEIIRKLAFFGCESLRCINMPSVRRVGAWAFSDCEELTDVEFGEDLERIGGGAFNHCTSLRRIAIPLKIDMIEYDEDDGSDDVFDYCPRLSTVEIVGGVHKVISSLHMDSWRNEMRAEIESIKFFRLPQHGERPRQ